MGFALSKDRSIFQTIWWSGPARFNRVCTFVFLLLGSGCSYVEAVDEQTIREAFPFIRDGQTTKKQVLAQFGKPDSEYDGGRILTYQAGCAGHARLALVQPPCVVRTYRLILVFGPGLVLESHSAVVEK